MEKIEEEYFDSISDEMSSLSDEISFLSVCLENVNASFSSHLLFHEARQMTMY